MKTHTIRWNGDKTIRIIKFSKPFIKQMLNSHPDACRLLLDKLINSLSKMVGKRHILDHDQFYNTELSQRLKYFGRYSNDIFKLNQWMYDGVRLLDCDLEIILKALDLYYKQMELISSEVK